MSVEEFREHVSDFAERTITPHAAEIDAQNSFPSSVNLWTEMGKMGLHGITVPDRCSNPILLKRMSTKASERFGLRHHK